MRPKSGDEHSPPSYLGAAAFFALSPPRLRGMGTLVRPEEAPSLAAILLPRGVGAGRLEFIFNLCSDSKEKWHIPLHGTRRDVHHCHVILIDWRSVIRVSWASSQGNKTTYSARAFFEGEALETEISKPLRIGRCAYPSSDWSSG